MEIKIDWNGGMSFSGVGDSGFVQKMDADSVVGGGNTGARPLEFLAMGLAGCTSMDVISILQKKKQPVSNFQVFVHVDRAEEHPKVFVNALVEYIVTGKDVDESALLRAIELSAEKYCPAQAMLSKAFPIQLVYKIIDENGTTLVKEGRYTPK